MTRRSKPPPPQSVKKVANPPKKEPSLATDETDEIEDSQDRILARPDGYYWRALDGQQEFGPFDTLAEAQADMDSGDEPDWLPAETLAEVESEIGISDWIDPETGQPAEGQAPPHLERE